MKLEMEELKNEVSNVDQQVSELVLVEGRGVGGGGGWESHVLRRGMLVENFEKYP